MVEKRLDHEGATAATAVPSGDESLADRLLPFIAMGGGVAGAVTGAVVGSEIGSALPGTCGTLGTMLGSGFAAGAWCLFTDLWRNLFVGYEDGHARDLATAGQRLTPGSNAR